MTTYRDEYPRPQFVRERWMNLNGLWQFELDPGNSGEARKYNEKTSFETQIMVPFCPESELSQVHHKDFITACWYRRMFPIPEGWLNGRILLHFGAVNYLCKVWINGRLAGAHRGGYSSFSIDIRDYVHEKENSIVVYAQSDVRLGKQPSGKQSPEYDSFGCFYTRTTGIWQTVWLEPVPDMYLDQIMLTPDVANQCLKISSKLPKGMARARLKAEAHYCGKAVGTASAFTSGNQAEVVLPLLEAHLWNPGEPELYDLSLKLEADGKTIDAVESYFGLRSIEISGPSVMINGKPVFQRLILDQGFYPKSVITAPSDAEIKADIDRGIAMGFNGARLHQKIFEARFLYWADHMGYIVWGEHGNWGLDISDGEGLKHFLPEWMEAVRRDYSSPALIGWCPFNETQRDTDPQVLETVYRVTKWMDGTRPVIDTSGWMHSDETDIYDYHDYEQDPKILSENVKLYAGAKAGEVFPQPVLFQKLNWRPVKCPVSKGQPIFVSEFGGFGLDLQSSGKEEWGYGKSASSKEEFIHRFQGQVDALLNTEGICGFCYTQLTDVEQEKNGLYTFDRSPKLPSDRIRDIVSSKAWNEA